MKVIYMAVTADKYELPIAVADTGRGLAQILHINERLVYDYISKNYLNGKHTKMRFYKVLV